jgi:hypothetical protein
MRKVFIFIVLVWFIVPAYSPVEAQVKKKKKPIVVKPNALTYELNFYLTPALTDLHSKKFGKEETGKLGFIGGFNFSYYVMKTPTALVTVGVGFNYSNYRTSRSLSYEGSVNSTDFNNDSVQINENATVIETQKVSFIELPLLMRYTYLFRSNTSVFFDFGPEFMIPIKETYQTTGPYTRTGYYPKYNVLLDNINNEVFYYPRNLQISNSGSLKVGNGLSLLLGAGLKQRLNYNISIFGALNFVYGVINMNKYSDKEAFLISSEYNKYNSLMGRHDKISNIAYGFQFGVSINLGKKPAEKSSGKSSGTGKQTSPSK